MFQFGHKNHFFEDPIFDNGYCYSRSSTYNGVVYVRCHEMSSNKCRARGTLNGGPISVSILHNHAQDPNVELIYFFKRSLYLAVTSSLQDLRLIYDDISLRHHQASILIPFVKVVKTMQTWRKLNCPPIPKTLDEYVIRLNSPRWKNLFFKNGCNLIATHLIGSDGSEAVVFFDQSNLLNFQTAHLYADATYKVCPRKPKVYQFFTVMASIHDTVVPVLWSLMTKKTIPCYIAVIDYFKGLTPHLQILSVTTDFEIGLRKVFQRFYPNASIKGCYFHFVQAVIKKAKKFGLWDKLDGWEDGQEFFRKLIGLAFLPADQIQNGFNYLKNVYSVFVSFFQSFLDYYQNYWINTVKPENWSIFGFSDRTNNPVESNNRRLNVKFGIHSRIWQFTESLISFYEITRTEIQSLRMSQAIRRSRRQEEMLQNAIINRAWELYNQNIFDVEHFLECVSHIVPVFRANNFIKDVTDVDNYVNVSLKRYIAVTNQTYIVMDEDDLNGIGGLLVISD